jgi:hypothetical protein
MLNYCSGGLAPYSYHNVQKYGFLSHHPIQIQDIAQGLPYYHPPLRIGVKIIDTILYNNFG